LSKGRRKNNILKIIIIRLIYLITILVVLYDLYFITYAILNPNETPVFLGFKTFSIISGSMAPEINIGDLIIVKKDENMEYKANEIVSFKQDEDIITHRIVKIRKEKEKVYYITRGDNNEVNDAKIEAKEIEGRVVYKIPYMGNIALFLKNRIVFGCILLILVLSYIHKKREIARKIRRKEKREKYERLMRINSNNENT